MKRFLSILLAAVMLLSLCACAKPQQEETQPQAGAPTDYSVTVRSQGGMALTEIEVFVYADDSLSGADGLGDQGKGREDFIRMELQELSVKL